MAIPVGKRAPAFTLESAKGTVMLADFAGKYLVLYFDTRDNTPACTTEALALRTAKAKLAKKGAVVVGVSKDSRASHTERADQRSLDFPLLPDPDGTTAQA